MGCGSYNYELGGEGGCECEYGMNELVLTKTVCVSLLASLEGFFEAQPVTAAVGSPTESGKQK